MPPRMLDLACRKCGAEVTDFFVRAVPSRIIHIFCGGRMEQVYRPASRNAQWDDKRAVVVFRKPDGTLSYPGRNDKPTPSGCERIELRSMSAVRSFERANNVIAHIAHFDEGTGRAIDDQLPDPLRGLPSEEQRFRRFRELTRGIF